MSRRHQIPAYQKALAAFHDAFADELRAIVEALPIAPGDRVIDLACGDGTYTGWLADRVGSIGRVVAVDLRPRYLEMARRSIGDRAAADRVDYVAANIRRMPTRESNADLVWCAQSLRSLPDPIAALRAMSRLVRPGGTVAVMEDDALHHIILPWPVELELSVRRAELARLADDLPRPQSYYLGRRLSQLFHAVGLTGITVTTWAVNRQAPLSAPVRSFVDSDLAALRRRVADRLDPETIGAFDRLADPSSDAYMPAQPDFALTCIEHVVRGVRPATD